MVAAQECPHQDVHKAGDQYMNDIPSSKSSFSSVQNLDELCSAVAWNANTGAIFALEKNDLPLVDIATALDAASGDVSFLVSLI
jgi:hypothetical protein